MGIRRFEIVHAVSLFRDVGVKYIRNFIFHIANSRYYTLVVITKMTLNIVFFLIFSFSN